MSNEEIVRACFFDPKTEMEAELARRLANEATTESDKKSQAVEWFRSVFARHAGEDHHTQIIHDLEVAAKMKKPECVKAITRTISMLEEMDLCASDSFAELNVANMVLAENS